MTVSLSMALTLTRRIFLHPCFMKSYSLGFLVTSSIQDPVFVNNSFGRFRVLDSFWERSQFLNPQCFCTGGVQQEKLCWDVSSQGVLLKKLDGALKSHQLDEAWEIFNDFKRLYAFPDDSIVSRFITELSYSSEPHQLKKACDLVFVILTEKSDLLKPDILTKLSLSLARAQMPVPASKMLRLMLQKGNLPPMNMLCLVCMHMVKTEIGTCLASNILIQICDRFLYLRAERSCAKLMKPDRTIFNLVLDACVRFRLSFKGQEIMELMSQTGVIADAHSITIIAKIHEMNGQRADLKRFKDYIDRVSLPFVHLYQQFYESLLSLHFMFDDIESAAELLLTLNKYRDSFPDGKLRGDSQNPCLVPIGSPNIRGGLKMQIMPELLERDSVLKIEGKEELIIFKNGKLLHTNKSLAKLITGYKRHGRISELSKLLLSIRKEYQSFAKCDVCSDVIHACVHLGLLETAHDILDDMESAGHPMDATSYMSLLAAYYKAKMSGEAKTLLRQMQKVGLDINTSEEMVFSSLLSEVVDRSVKSDLAETLLQEMKEKEKAVPSMIYEFNSSIYYFCKGKMIGDALTIYQRMQGMKIQPTVQTFGYLVYAYSSLEMYRDITILWSDIKRNMETGKLMLSSDLFEFLLLNFLRGGYFERVMEVIGYMKENSMYTDKWKYKIEFLKHHRNLYRSLKASNARTEAQSKRLEYVRAFRNWAGIH